MKTIGKPALWKAILFSIIGAILGSGIYILIYGLGYIAVVGLLAIILLAKLGYDLGGGSKKMIVIIPTILIISIIVSLCAFYVGEYLQVVKEMASAYPGVSVGFFNLFSILSTYGKPGALSTDLIAFVVILIITIVIFLGSIISENKIAKRNALMQERIESDNDQRTDDNFTNGTNFGPKDENK